MGRWTKLFKQPLRLSLLVYRIRRWSTDEVIATLEKLLLFMSSSSPNPAIPLGFGGENLKYPLRYAARIGEISSILSTSFLGSVIYVQSKRKLSPSIDLDTDPFVQDPRQKASLGPCNYERTENQLVHPPFHPTQPHTAPIRSSWCARTPSLAQTCICIKDANESNDERRRDLVVHEAHEARLCAGLTTDEERTHKGRKEEGQEG